MEITVLIHKGDFLMLESQNGVWLTLSNVLYKDLVSRLLYDKDDITTKSNVVLPFSE
jgi:hypothetical protein